MKSTTDSRRRIILEVLRGNIQKAKMINASLKEKPILLIYKEHDSGKISLQIGSEEILSPADIEKLEEKHELFWIELYDSGHPVKFSEEEVEEELRREKPEWYRG